MSYKRFDLVPVWDDFRTMTRVSPKKVANRSKEMEAFRKKVTSSKEAAREFLLKTGVYTKSGKLSANFR